HAPAADLANAHARAGVAVAGRDVDHRRHADRRQRGQQLVVAEVAEVAVAELAAIVEPPATQPAVLQDRAGVLAAEAELEHRARQHDVADVARKFVDADVVDGAVAELAELAAAPAAEPAAVDQRAGVLLAGGDVVDGGEGAVVVAAVAVDLVAVLALLVALDLTVAARGGLAGPVDAAEAGIAAVAVALAAELAAAGIAVAVTLAVTVAGRIAITGRITVAVTVARGLGRGGLAAHLVGRGVAVAAGQREAGGQANT